MTDDNFHAHGMVPAQLLRARDITDSIRACLRSAAQSFIDAGERLKVAFDMEIWETMGLHSWQEYCERELGITDANAYDLIRIRRLKDKFPDFESRMLDAGISKLRLLLPVLEKHEDEKTFDGLLDEANTKSWRDLRRTIREAEDGGGENDGNLGEHPFITCPRCRAVIYLSRMAAIVDHRQARIVGHVEQES